MLEAVDFQRFYRTYFFAALLRYESLDTPVNLTHLNLKLAQKKLNSATSPPWHTA
jgi:hypothetical protein